MIKPRKIEFPSKRIIMPRLLLYPRVTSADNDTCMGRLLNWLLWVTTNGVHTDNDKHLIGDWHEELGYSERSSHYYRKLGGGSTARHFPTHFSYWIEEIFSPHADHRVIINPNLLRTMGRVHDKEDKIWTLLALKIQRGRCGEGIDVSSLPALDLALALNPSALSPQDLLDTELSEFTLRPESPPTTS